LRRETIEYLKSKPEEFAVYNLGPFETCGENECHYPYYAKQVCDFITYWKMADRGILICGTGIGMSIAANKCKGIRAARCLSEGDSIACRRHNDANVLCLPEEFARTSEFQGTIYEFLCTKFNQVDRHQHRVDMMMKLEEMDASRQEV
jgi:ribose 5-phosphate isomerase B